MTLLKERGSIYAGTHAAEQERELKDLLVYVSQYSPFYRELLLKNNIDIDDIKTVADLRKLPTTTKDDLQQGNNDFLCVPQSGVAEYTSTSGTLGSPVTIALTENDLQRLAANEYNSFLCADGSKDDTYQLMLTLDRQ
ncbi:MAG TPA: phenylacetate--CoA ligase family protein, partial [Mucilaginibacter sp.]|nr:phenylacetate--CoA ligase family protein [Mucilaginibacter sp.]